MKVIRCLILQKFQGLDDVKCHVDVRKSTHEVTCGDMVPQYMVSMVDLGI
jgi:hypothetical protein